MQRGFSLVELSIVLVILGLLTGGILAGQSLIESAQLRAIVVEHDRYLAAANTFRDKYFALPGDMANATSFWGKNPTYCPGHTGAASASGACNGNGNGRLELAALPNNPDQTDESFQFWKHLALAGLIEADVTGATRQSSPCTAQATHRYCAENSPRSKYENALWASSSDMSEFGVNDWGVPAGNAMWLVAWLNPQNMWNIDTKVDDGKPGSGTLISGVMAWAGGGCGGADSCSVSCPATVPGANAYLLSHSSKTCNPMWINQY